MLLMVHYDRQSYEELRENILFLKKGLDFWYKVIILSIRNLLTKRRY